MSDIVQKLWGFCHTLRHDGVDYGDYIEQLPEQQEVVRRVEALFALADQIEARFKKAQVQAWPVVAMRSRLDKLTPSLLAHAFRGKLVPQDPKDESADKLFERINTKESSHEKG